MGIENRKTEQRAFPKKETRVLPDTHRYLPSLQKNLLISMSSTDSFSVTLLVFFRIIFWIRNYPKTIDWWGIIWILTGAPTWRPLPETWATLRKKWPVGSTLTATAQRRSSGSSSGTTGQWNGFRRVARRRICTIWGMAAEKRRQPHDPKRLTLQGVILLDFYGRIDILPLQSAFFRNRWRKTSKFLLNKWLFRSWQSTSRHWWYSTASRVSPWRLWPLVDTYHSIW